MEQTSTVLETPVSTPDLAFKGKGSELFGIQIVNILLMIVTLGLYYPWAKAKNLQYIYRKTELSGSPFAFHGTGKEMFKGFIKGIGIIAALYSVLIYGAVNATPDNMGVYFICFGIFMVGIIALIPVAIHGMMRYRTSRTSWRGIHMGYRGTLGSLSKVYAVNLLLTIVSLGIYGSWFTVKLRQEILGNVRFGNVRFSFEGEGSELFMIHLKGYLLSMLTLGIYFFWYSKDLINFYIDNIWIEQDGKYSRLESSLSGSEFFKLAIGNIFIMVFTLGLGYSWTVTRTLSAIINNCEVLGDFNPEELEQTEGEYKNAMYEDMADMLDIGIV